MEFPRCVPHNAPHKAFETGIPRPICDFLCAATHYIRGFLPATRKCDCQLIHVESSHSGIRPSNRLCSHMFSARVAFHFYAHFTLSLFLTGIIPSLVVALAARMSIPLQNWDSVFEGSLCLHCWRNRRASYAVANKNRDYGKVPRHAEPNHKRAKKTVT